MDANDANKNKKEIIHPELSYKLTGILFKVHNNLGRFCREKQYYDELEILLKETNLKYKREISDKKGDRFDFFIEDKIILEAKAKPFIKKEDYYQILRYLELNDIKLGIIVNFRNNYLKPKRVLNSKN